MSVSQDRWTCPSCSRTVVIDATAADTAACIEAVQLRHARAHQAADRVVRRLGFPKPARRRTA